MSVNFNIILSISSEEEVVTKTTRIREKGWSVQSPRLSTCELVLG